MKNVLGAIIAIVIAQAAGFLGSFFTMPAIGGWYATLVRPELTPPNWVFGPVWTMLYVFMGIASYIVWKRGSARPEVRRALTLYGIQLALNAAWSIVFFAFENPGGALVVIAALWAMILATMIAFYRISRTAALLLVPYILWVSFAAHLNYSIWMLN